MDITRGDLKHVPNPELDPVQIARRLRTLAHVRAMAASRQMRRTPQGVAQDPHKREAETG